MRNYLTNGSNGYEYWNIALPEGGVSRWGWAQNSLVSVDKDRRTFRWNHEYYLLKHVAGLVRPGARRIGAVSWTGHEDVLAFRNPDASISIVAHNPLRTPLPLRIGIGDKILETVLPPDSFGSVLLLG
jgi:glucosylceramidase